MARAQPPSTFSTILPMFAAFHAGMGGGGLRQRKFLVLTGAMRRLIGCGGRFISGAGFGKARTSGRAREPFLALAGSKKCMRSHKVRKIAAKTWDRLTSIYNSPLYCWSRHGVWELRRACNRWLIGLITGLLSSFVTPMIRRVIGRRIPLKMPSRDRR